METDCALCAISARERAAKQQVLFRELRIAAQRAFYVTEKFMKNFLLHKNGWEFNAFPTIFLSMFHM